MVNETLEYRCGCVFSNNRWFPECPRHNEWWTIHIGNNIELTPEKYKDKGAYVVNCQDSSKTLSSLKDNSVKLFLTYPMFQYETLELKQDALFRLMRTKIKERGVLCLMCDLTNLASSMLLLESSGFSVKSIVNVLYDKNTEVLIPNVLVVATIRGKKLKCKNTYGRLPKTLYYSGVATAESFLVKTFTDQNDLVVDPFCTNVHTLDGTMHEKRRFLGFCSSNLMFEKLKFYIDKFEANTDAFQFRKPNDT